LSGIAPAIAKAGMRLRIHKKRRVIFMAEFLLQQDDPGCIARKRDNFITKGRRRENQAQAFTLKGPKYFDIYKIFLHFNFSIHSGAQTQYVWATEISPWVHVFCANINYATK
jgi:hypothetical protein